MINFKVAATNLMAEAALKVAKNSANTACQFIYHEPKAPESLKKLKKY